MSRPIGILSVIGELLLGGGENRLLSLARCIDRVRFEHRIVVLNGADLRIEERAVMPKQYAEAGIAVHELESDSEQSRDGLSTKGKSLAKRVGGLMQLIETHDIDVIDAHMETAALAGTIAGAITRRPVCVTLYHAQPLVAPCLWRVARQFILKAADLLLTDSALRAEEIRQATVLKRPRVCVAPNGVWIPRAARTDAEVRTLLRIPPRSQSRVVGQISAFVEFKGQLVLLEAARRVLRDEPDVYFVLVGYTSHESDFRRRVEQKAFDLEIADHVRILNYPGPIGDIWQVIDIHVHASLFDSLPQAIIEGMSLAKPAVVTAVGGVPEAVIDGRTGLVVPPGDSTALANGISQLLRDPSLSRKLGDAAFIQYERGYRPELMARKLEACFESLVERRNRKHAPKWKQLKDALS
jgi:glycosyltransferase involved in cell wall biosynthesis